MRLATVRYSDAMPAPPPQLPAHEDVVLARLRKKDRLLTGLLLGGLFLFMYVLMIPVAMGMAGAAANCSDEPAGCNEGLIAFSQFLGIPALLVIFVASIIVSVIRISRHKRAFYVPLLGAGAMIVCFVAYGLTVNAGLGI